MSLHISLCYNNNLKQCVQALEKKLEEKEQRLKVLEEKLNISKEPLKTVLSCNLCANSFDSKKNLKKHRMEKHPQKIKCKNCDGTFARNCDLELHMIAEHESEKYKCDKCEKTFILNWRFKKHQQSHSSETVKK